MSELLFSNPEGFAIKSDLQMIRIGGSVNASSAFFGYGTTTNQIQFYNNNSITSAFDVNGFYICLSEYI